MWERYGGGIGKFVPSSAFPLIKNAPETLRFAQEAVQKILPSAQFWQLKSQNPDKKLPNSCSQQIFHKSLKALLFGERFFGKSVPKNPLFCSKHQPTPIRKENQLKEGTRWRITIL